MFLLLLWFCLCLLSTVQLERGSGYADAGGVILSGPGHGHGQSTPGEREPSQEHVAPTCKNNKSNASSTHWELKIISPQQGALFAGHLHFMIQLEKRIHECDFDLNQPDRSVCALVCREFSVESKVNFPISVYVNDRLIHKGRLESSVFEGLLPPALFLVDRANNLEVVIDISESDVTVVLAQRISFHWQPPSKYPIFKAISDALRPQSSRLKAVLLAGLPNCMTSSFASSDPGRLELFITSSTTTLTRVHCDHAIDQEQSMQWNSSRIYHNWGNDLKQIRNIANVDHAVVMIDSIIEFISTAECQHVSKCDNRKVEDGVFAYIRDVVLRTRTSIWILSEAQYESLSMSATSNLIARTTALVLARLESALSSTFNRVTFVANEDTESAPFAVWAHTVSAADIDNLHNNGHLHSTSCNGNGNSHDPLFHILLNRSSIDAALLAQIDRCRYSQTIDSLQSTQQSTKASTQTELRSTSKRVSKLLAENYDVGTSFILLENVCLSRRFNSAEEVLKGMTDYTLELFRDPQSNDDGSVYKHLQKMNIYTVDKGFAFSGLAANERPWLANASGTTSALISDKTAWLSGLTMLTVPAVYNQLHHTIEPMLKLLYLANLPSKHRIGGIHSANTNTSMEIRQKNPLALFGLYPIKRMILGKFAPQTAGDWLWSVIGLILGYYESSLQTSEYDEVFAPALYTIESFFNLDVTSPQTVDNKIPAEITCFEQLALFGYTNTHIMFFGGRKYGSLFKKYVYSALSIPLKAPTGNAMYTGELFVNVSKHATSNKDYGNAGTVAIPSAPLAPRQRKLKITMVLRDGRVRRIVNGVALQRTILSATTVDDGGFHIADEQWLLTHTSVLETLTFREQVQLFSETDVLVTVHGAAIANAMFMRHGSVVIDIFNANYIEFFFHSILRDVGVLPLSLPISNHTRQTSDCDPSVPPECYKEADRGLHTLACVKIRQCSVEVDLVRFKVVLMEAYNHVLAVKWFPSLNRT